MSNVVFTIDTNSSGGAERVTANLANYLVAQHHDVTIINSDTDSAFYELDNRVKVIKWGLDRKKLNSIQRFFIKTKLLRSFFANNKPDAVVTFLFHMEAPTILAGLATKTRVFTSVRNSAKSYTKFERLFRRVFYPFIAGVVFQSNAVMEFKDFKRVVNKKVIMNPLEGGAKEYGSPVPFNLRKQKIITVGRLNNQKNHKLLIEAFSKSKKAVDDYTLHIFGKGALADNLKDLIIQKGLENKVFLEGEVLNASRINRDAYAFVLSSDFEGFPNALVEAMAYGIPSLSTKFDSGVAEQLITPGKNGFLCRVNSVDDMVKNIDQLLSLSHEKYEEIVAESCKIADVLDLRTIGRQWEEFLLS